MKTLLKKVMPSFVLDAYHRFLAFLGAFLYGFPSKKMVVIGITGTNGKSTVVEMCHRILAEAGFSVASISSIRFKINEREWRNELKMTMPGRFLLQKFLRQAIGAGCRYAVLEVTSEGIKQHRHEFIDFHAAAITNLTPEHIESHGGFEKYREAKGEFFRAVRKVHIVNLDDKNAEYFLGFPAERTIKYQIKENQIVIDGNPIPINLKLLGQFNLYNAAAAICVGLSQGIDIETCKKALEKIEAIPGRLEVVVREPFTVIVDYAHTPDALENVYKTVESSMFHVPCSMICVLGAAGGGRDKWKRPELGKIAAQYCDQIILTDEDPYDENPLSILENIESGFSQIQNPKSKIQNYERILDRREAIKKALNLARAGDTVVITGKGCEPWMMVESGKKIPWDDRQIAKEELQKLHPPKFCRGKI